ncbi:MAG: hypothetical protein KAS04_00475 [Candidatus Aenigmarchaeota archaeon]|nr:hypothetical protein [Candidatus Aenigmarchaeota archaeon]
MKKEYLPKKMMEAFSTYLSKKFLKNDGYTLKSYIGNSSTNSDISPRIGHFELVSAVNAPIPSDNVLKDIVKKFYNGNNIGLKEDDYSLLFHVNDEIDHIVSVTPGDTSRISVIEFEL